MSLAWLCATVFTILYLSHGSNGDKCVTINFEYGFHKSFPNDAFMCELFESNWLLRSFNGTEIAPPHENSEHFITPSHYYSCASTVPLPITGGRIEINIYNEGDNNLVVTVLDAFSDIVLGNIVVDAIKVTGWETLYFNVRPATYAKIVFIGKTDNDSKILIDSLKFIPESLIGIHEEEDSCIIYNNDDSNELSTTTESDISPTPDTYPTTETSTTEETYFDQTCIVFNFEQNLDVDFPNTAAICKYYEPWNLGTFDSIAPPYAVSTKFIYPSKSLSCISSKPVKLRSGVLEIKVYVKDNDKERVLTIGIGEYPLGSHLLASQHVHFEKYGWQYVNVTFDGHGYEDGMILLLGTAWHQSLLIDSIRFIPTKFLNVPEDELPDSCKVYPKNIYTTEPWTTETKPDYQVTDSTTDKGVTETKPDYQVTDSTTDKGVTETKPDYEVTDSTTNPNYTTDSDISTDPNFINTTTAHPGGTEPYPIKECVTYSFENYFDYKFHTNVPLCSSINATWYWKYYDFSTIMPPNHLSTRFIVPTPEEPSCVASFPFKISSGLLEVNLYMESPNAVLTIFVVNAVNIFETIGGSVVSGLDGWNTVNVTVNVDRNVPAYVTFIGNEVKNSTIVIDSFRFIPEHLSPDDDSCQIYIEPYTTTEYMPTTNAPEIDDRECITYNFQNYNSSAFSDEGFICSLLPGVWNRGFYNESSFAPPHTKSTTFMSPSPFTPSCMSSIPFNLSTGTIEINIYSQFNIGDGFSVLVWDSRGDSIGLGSAVVQSLSGWNTVSLRISTDETVLGYISLIGYTTGNATLLVDSLRFIPSNLPETDESCRIYPDYTKCVKFDLEDHFYTNFTSKVPMCSPILQSWHWRSYADSNIDSPRKESTMFIAPSTGNTSCIASRYFTVGTGKVVINLFTNTTHNDALSIFVVNSADDSSIVAGSFILPGYGWQSASINISTKELIRGYIVFIGHETDISTIIVDSFKFVPYDDIYCELYSVQEHDYDD